VTSETLITDQSPYYLNSKTFLKKSWQQSWIWNSKWLTCRLSVWL